MQLRTRALRTAGIRRCGRRHTADPQSWPSGTFTDEEVRILLADPDLVVEILDGSGAGTSGQTDELAQKTVAALRTMAGDLGIDLELIEGTGKGGNVIKEDIVSAIRAHDADPGSALATGPQLVVETEEEGGAPDPESDPEIIEADTEGGE